jgi:hypothetical protein
MLTPPELVLICLLRFLSHSCYLSSYLESLGERKDSMRRTPIYSQPAIRFLIACNTTYFRSGYPRLPYCWLTWTKPSNEILSDKNRNHAYAYSNPLPNPSRSGKWPPQQVVGSSFSRSDLITAFHVEFLLQEGRSYLP